MKKILLMLSLIVMVALVGCTSDQEYIEEQDHSHDDEHDYSVEIEGSEMKLLTVQEVADLWDIDSEILLQKIIQEFDLKENYNIDVVLEDIREEYAFSPAMIKDFAEEIKQQNIQNE